ncbi:uncharacterized protein LOC103495083 isoform X1 [Cucumis melo]|uniref:Uncharacterized protein LOC103495083 isoform X1 n=1 Tax=Cucumis melo TaxID=3656 RepID=A0ABM3L973_CUCME|nr:uncharacterized protein LOC103495083 isoform X1 [Cucumis melo]XP_050946591.1 uncharacterized protein LOC103495083 isoform X1 [Cucumis melo]
MKRKFMRTSHSLKPTVPNRMHSGCWSNYSKVQFMLQWKNCIWLKEMKKLRFEFVLESKRARCQGHTSKLILKLSLERKLGQGRDKALQYLKDNPALQDEIEKELCVMIGGSIVFSAAYRCCLLLHDSVYVHD